MHLAHHRVALVSPDRVRYDVVHYGTASLAHEEYPRASQKIPGMASYDPWDDFGEAADDGPWDDLGETADDGSWDDLDGRADYGP